ncbi:MAG TPA: c-type cytochrome biogenesis protein CcmI [Pyrinomonadaceae bacterium]|jgi:cytochrome c-type biogenesis protein CcmH
MITFWLVNAFFVVIALAFILPPLLQGPEKNQEEDDTGRKEANLSVYRDQIAEMERDLENGILNPEQYRQDRDELERRLLEDVSPKRGGEPAPVKVGSAGRGLVYGIALAIPLVAVALYLTLGNPNAISASGTAPSPAAGPMSPSTNGQRSQQQIEANVAALAKRLEQNPGDVQGWMMLARSYSSMERFSDASAAYAKATALKTDDANLWAEYAFATAMANGRSLQGQPLDLINKALQVDPENPKALQLAGSAAFEGKNYQQAIDYWQRVLQKTSPESEVGQAIAERIAEARTLANGPK